MEVLSHVRPQCGSSFLCEIRIHDPGRIYEGRAGVHGDGNPKRFHDLFPCGPVLDRGIRMGDDVTVALPGDPYRQRDQFSVGFGIEFPKLRGGAAEITIPADGIRINPANIRDRGASCL